ncbi:phosphodiester glycosidase family protein [Paenibacillus chartarius]|uniref:Phosphodiester glycosidase family protein n=1 Tax=Paenibacillus chartarius TaxID=747481 RepID=A0ABV6DS68_9BACL
MQLRIWLDGWSWYKKWLMALSVLAFACSTFLYWTPPGTFIREKLAETVIMTQHRWYAWVLVGGDERERMVQALWTRIEEMGEAEQQFDMVTVTPRQTRSKEELIRVEDISGSGYKGKMMWVYDPTSIRMVVPAKPGMGERITEMVERTGAVAGVNAGGFDDPDGLGNGFAPIGMIVSDSELLYDGGGGKQPIVGFTAEGKLVVGNYTIEELRSLQVKEAASFYPRVILDGKPLITSGDGGTGKQPRTAVGQKADGTVIFIVIDGRQANWSIGATLREVQDLFLAQGVINAGFLDGGASSELVVGGELVTRPSSRYGERRLPSAFLVFDDPDSVVVTNPWAGLAKIDPGGAASHPEFQEELRRQREQAARNPAPKAEAPAGSAGGDGAPGATGAGAGKGGSTVTSGTYGADGPPAGAAQQPAGGRGGAAGQAPQATPGAAGSAPGSGAAGGSPAAGAPAGGAAPAAAAGAATGAAAGSGSARPATPAAPPQTVQP